MDWTGERVVVSGVFSFIFFFYYLREKFQNTTEQGIDRATVSLTILTSSVF